MARPPRGGFRSADMRGTLGSLLKSTLAQAGVVRDVIERGAREGRSRLDEARAGRRRQEALAELGEAVLELIRRGEIDLGELPEVRDIVTNLDELDAAHEPRTSRRAWGRDDPDRDPGGGLGDIALPTSRGRFDDRDRGGDGTVSSSRWTPPSGPTARATEPRVWRPIAERAAASPVPPAVRAHKGGGITFDDDDLAEYMHPDDVPPKPPHDES